MYHEYWGITYPRLLKYKLCNYIWKKLMCPKQMHLLDEVLSDRHYLVCDACGFIVDIK